MLISKHITPVFFAVTFAVALSLFAAPAKAISSAEKSAVLTKIESFLNGLSTFKANFIQETEAGDVSTGEFYLKRPGRMRFEYAPPVPVVMVSTGRTITYYDHELDQISTLPLDGSLAGFLTQKTIKFDNPAIEILSVSQMDGILSVALRQKEKPDEGELTLEFQETPLKLASMTTKDATGQTTRVAFTSAEYGLPLDKKLFQPPHKSVFDKRR